MARADRAEKMETKDEGLDAGPSLCVQKIAMAVEHLGVNSSVLGEKLGFARNRIPRWVAGSGEPDGYEIQTLAKALDRDVIYLISDSIPLSEPGPKFRDLTKLVEPEVTAAAAAAAAAAAGAAAGRGLAAAGGSTKDGKAGEELGGGEQVGADLDLDGIKQAMNQLFNVEELLEEMRPDLLRLKTIVRRAVQGSRDRD